MRTAIVMLLMAATGLYAAEPLALRVLREKLGRDESGRLEVSDSGVVYTADNGKTTLQFDFADIRTADLSDPRAIRIETYDVLKRKIGGRRVYTFRLSDAIRDDRLIRFFVARLNRPVVGYYAESAPVRFKTLAYHRHRLGGCSGTVEIGSDAIRFVGLKSGESRTWLYRDVESIGSPDPFHLRVTTFAETYTFDLKERLPAEAYESMWQRVYNMPRQMPTGDATISR